VGVQRYFDSIHSDISLRYNYQVLNAEDAPTASLDIDEESTVSSFTLSLKHDRRDNPLYPRAGYKVFTSVEYASPMLAGSADFVLAEAAGSIHVRLGGGRYLHTGLEHGVAVPFSSSDTALPFNKRFFPGGENSVRGYQYGEASPLDGMGEELGAESFAQGNIELEQALTPSWSLVVFVDGVLLAEDINDYPGSEILYSAGGGIRWKTIVGPVRLEYGHNLNPRESDPDGTLHFSIGFPF
jgi:outer membrane translocation and assembly module TamA